MKHTKDLGIPSKVNLKTFDNKNLVISYTNTLTIGIGELIMIIAIKFSESQSSKKMILKFDFEVLLIIVSAWDI